jgi:tetratricopeptide (TPR) repeat protein
MTASLAILLLAAAALLLGACAAAPPDSPAPPGPPEPLPRLGDLWDFGDPAASEARFRALLPRAGAAADAEYRVEALTQVARAEGLRMRFDDALRTLDGAEAALRPGMDRARTRVLLERGRVLNSSNRPAEAAPLFGAAWEAARAAGLDGLAVDAAHMLGIVRPGAEGLDWNLRALALAETSADPEAAAWAGSLANNIGWAHHGEGRYEEALASFRTALAFREARGQAGGIRVARWCVARCLRSLGRVPEALAMQEALLAETEAAGRPDGFVHEELGECLLLLGRADEARPRFRRAHELLAKDPWLARDEPARLERLRSLGAE